MAHRGEIVISAIQTAAVGNSQFEYINYLPNKYAEAAANGFEDIGGVTGIVGLITDAGGLIPNTIVQGISMVIGGILGLTGVVSGDISGDIRDITDNGGDIILSYVNTKFGGFYSVEEWDGKTCVRFPIEVSKRARLKTIFLTIAKLSMELSFLFVEWSSSKITSNLQ